MAACSAACCERSHSACCARWLACASRMFCTVVMVRATLGRRPWVLEMEQGARGMRFTPGTS